jgi:hypothetical protein
MSVRAICVVWALGCLGTGAARAQSVRIENVTVVPRDAKTAAITFDISWSGSWRTEINHDAAWVFFKIQPKGEATWRHARLVADKVIDPTGYSAGKGAAVELVVPDGKDGYTGLFVRRAAPHVPANLAVSNVTVLAETPAQNTEVRAFGIVMVYVPEGPFYLGSGGAEAKGFYRYTDGSQSTQPYRVTGPGKIPIGTRDGCLWARDGGMDKDGGEIPASFPNGYAAFYFMKAQMLGEEAMASRRDDPFRRGAELRVCDAWRA